MDVYKFICNGERIFLFELKEECKMCCVKLIVWSLVTQEGINILVFYIFEYGAECSAESGAKWYLI